jgi:hypothetical protein
VSSELEQRLKRFRSVASPQARELASYLAAAPLTLPVMRLVQRVMLPESRQIHLAEVFLGGLLKRITPVDAKTHPNRIQYDFIDDHLRDLLLRQVLVPDAIDVLREVSAFIHSRAGQSLDFEAILENPDTAGDLVVDDQSRPFARVAAQVIAKLGGKYAESATRLSTMVAQSNASEIGITPDASSALHRYGEISLPSQLFVGQTEALHITLTLQPSTSQAVSIELDASGSMELDAVVVVSPLEFELQGSNVQTIRIKPQADSDSGMFKLIPKQAGETTIAMEFFQNSRYLNRVEVTTTVLPDAQAAPSVQFVSTASAVDTHSQQATPVSTAHAEIIAQWLGLPPDLTILFDRIVTGNNRYKYRFQLRSPIRRVNLVYDEFVTEETDVVPQGILEYVLADLNALIGDTSLSEEVFFERLNAIGTDLYNRLFPNDLKRLYWDKIRDHVQTVMIISDEPWIPWELLRPYHPDTYEEEDGFLCEKFNLTRWLRGTGVADTVQAGRLGMIMATNDLGSAHLEAEQLKQLFGDLAEEIGSSSEEIHRVLRTGGYSLLHFACHGSYHATNPDKASLYLPDGSRLEPRDLNGQRLAFSKDTPFVFLNARETGQGAYALTGHGGWAEAFVQRGKGSGFIGTMWAAQDESAHKFAVEFYTQLHHGKSVAEAVRLARQAIKKAFDPTWLTYTVYANPLARLAKGS